ITRATLRTGSTSDVKAAYTPFFSPSHGRGPGCTNLVISENLLITWRDTLGGGEEITSCPRSPRLRRQQTGGVDGGVRLRSASRVGRRGPRGVAAARPSFAGDSRLPVVAADLRSGPAAQPLPARQLLGKATGALSPSHRQAPLTLFFLRRAGPVCRRPSFPQAPLVPAGPCAESERDPQTLSPWGLLASLFRSSEELQTGAGRGRPGSHVSRGPAEGQAGRPGRARAHVGSRARSPARPPGPHLPLTRRTMANTERTFIAIKPDGVQRGLVGDIIKRFEQKGFRLVAMKFLRASEELLKQHYIDLKDRPFYPGLVKYMNSGPVVAMVWEGLNVVKTGRMMLGETNPADSKPGTIRGDFCIQVGRNIIHGSDSVKSAEREISLWFKPEELVDYKSCAFDWIYE
uniref:Nucleoside diphosphate kinase n=2 Tax=Rhinolophus TaxID=49442 RepID=A0A671EN12_RHIFE